MPAATHTAPPTLGPILFLTFTPSPTPTETSSPTPTVEDKSAAVAAGSAASDTMLPTAPAATATPVSLAWSPAEPPVSRAGEVSQSGTWEGGFFRGVMAAIILLVVLTGFVVAVGVSLLIAWRIIRFRAAQARSQPTVTVRENLP